MSTILVPTGAKRKSRPNFLYYCHFVFNLPFIFFFIGVAKE